MDDIQSRDEAIRRYLAGNCPAEICRALGRSKTRLYKWLKRYDPANLAWGQSRSRGPYHLTTKTLQGMERLGCKIR
jgi:transposase-like protein